ncbi:hypothetical protein GXP67_26590 [Rhodocytophaga rosea]|uniref:Heavy-metal-associated domain-containing protein n=1 Tax=Rhodocytophaga rosea TaxID=2704465 RepID=A0A6C0GR31_9BACT|nr:hypothetical protein [Rhodocytophaga rosea]QHT69960.1 hypothetical protein GXP67_26590 [Rhodocytophaga rosea]
METIFIHPDKVVEVFKTNVNQEWQVQFIIAALEKLLPEARITFDLDDCDKILRIEGQVTLINIHQIIQVISAFGYHAEVLR